MRGNDSIAGSFFSIGDLVRGNNPVARVEESVLKGKTDHDSDSANFVGQARSPQTPGTES